MAMIKDLVSSLTGKLNLSRRGFVKGTLALSAVASIYGCSKGNGEGETIYTGGGGNSNAVPEEDLSNPQTYWTACVHNCGAGDVRSYELGQTKIRCANKLHVVNGRVVRVTSDDSDYDFEGGERDKNQWNDTRSLSCPKGRAFKYKLYHPGKLKYVLKQTKARGDVTGFIRITLEQAMNEIAKKCRTVHAEYGPGAIYQSYGSSDYSTFANAADARSALTTFYGGVRGSYSDYSFHQYNFAWPLTGHPGIQSEYENQYLIGGHLGNIAAKVNTIVSWGSNTLSTNNTTAYGYIQAAEKMKKRGGKIYHISPEFVDTGVTLATDWVQIRNYTDTALVMAMLYEMLINTFNTDGSVKTDAWLDVNYLDTMVYGFFDSPAYWIMTKTDVANAGEISLEEQTGDDWRKVDAVPAGMSLSAYVMGSDDRLQKSKYLNSQNYTAQKFSGVGGYEFRNMSGCSLTINGKPANQCTEVEINASKYAYKKDLMKPKTADWAEKICGTPASTIRALAKRYCTPEAHPILSEWCGGLQKQENGVVNLFAIGALMAVTKTFGRSSEGLYGSWGSYPHSVGEKMAGELSSSGSIPVGRPTSAITAPADPTREWYVPSISCKEWFNALKVGFFDTLKEKGYTGKSIPDWDGKSRYLNDDGGAKTSIKWKHDSTGKVSPYTGDDGKDYWDYEGREEGKPKFVGTRMIIQSGGGIQMNQHFNTNDTAEMFKLLPLGTDPADPHTFCFVQFDIFMSPSARFADYVIPTVTSLEAGEWHSLSGQTVYRPPIVKPLGDAVDGWRLAFEAYKAQAKLGGNNINGVAIDANAHWKYVGSTAAEGYKSAEVLSLKIVDDARKNANNRFYGMSREEVYATQYQPRKNDIEPDGVDTLSPLRSNLDSYLGNPTKMLNEPFVFSGADSTAGAGTAQDWGANVSDLVSTTGIPKFAGRMQVYSGRVVWEYEHRFEKWHGWLPKEQRGQKNADYEGDKKILPIPIYFNFEDGFAEAYGSFQSGKPLSELVPNGLTMGTTHDRYRVHSTNAENPLLKELTHRTKGGKWASGNDWKEYAVMPERHSVGGNAPIPAMISSAVSKKDLKTASWHEIWMNTQDANERGIVDGDLVRVQNPIGAVRVIARVTDRCVRGHVNLHQGGWYDPNPIDGVDDGGCANTLMSCKPSRYDNGNAQQSAFVTIKKETNF